MAEQIITIPSPPTAGQPFLLDYSNLSFYPIFNNLYELRNANNISLTSSIQNVITLFTASVSGFYIVPNGNFFYLSDGSTTIYKINASGVVVSQINTGVSNIRGLAFDTQNNLYFVRYGVQVLYKIDTLNNITTTYVSNTGITDACGLCRDTFGNFYIESYAFGIINKVDTSLIVTTFANVDGFGLVIDTNNNLYASNQAGFVKKITPLGVVTNFVNVVSAFTMYIFNGYLYVVSNNSFYGGLPPPNQITVVNLSDISSYVISLPSIAFAICVSNNILYFSGNNDTDQFNLGFNFSNVTLPSGYNNIKLYNITNSSVTATFTVFVDGPEPGPEPGPGPGPGPETGIICFKEGTKILCKFNGADVYVPVEYISEGMLVKTYKNGYKKCKFNMKELLHNTDEHSINNLFRLSKLTNGNLFEDLYITGSHSMLYDNLSKKEENSMNKLIATYNANFDIDIRTKIEDKYKLISYYDNTFTEVKQNININIYHLVLESDSQNRNYGIWANGALTESIDEFTMLNHLNNKSKVTLINVAKNETVAFNNIFLSKGNMNMNFNNKTLGTKHMNVLTNFK